MNVNLKLEKMINNDLYKYAIKSPMKNRYAAALIYRNKILSIGFNNYYGKIREEHKSCLLCGL
jgi:hypothetical protein